MVYCSINIPDAARQDMGRPAAFQAEDRGVRLSLAAPLTSNIY